MKKEKRVPPQRVQQGRRASAGPIVFRTNTIFEDNGKTVYLEAGKPSPFFDISDVPARLQNHIAGPTIEVEESDEPAHASFTLGVPYAIRADGRLGRELQRNVQREMAQQQADAEFEDALEEEIANEELPAAIAEQITDTHREHVDREIAQARAVAERTDEIMDAAIEASQPSTLYARRGKNFVEVGRANLRSCESIFVKGDDGDFEFIGKTDRRGELPDVPIKL